ncbi:hypothetical protein GGX14DRAFT_574101 [Mycena pura]|uniref:Uncharacterized protein n=1 Tax=Mycena pura TaxID=153505 RepID=A0AAD6Y3N9_9AGAR|nr:hypothetical protein GGX14DRAFT_574101 [Mycena pura]
MAPSRGRRWQTPFGRAAIARIVREKIPEWKGGLREWQLIIVAWILDGHDVLCITATGDGKSAIFAQDTCENRDFAHKRPHEEHVFELEALGVSAFAYTSEEVAETRDQGRNIAQEIAACHWSIVVVSQTSLGSEVAEKDWEAGLIDTQGQGFERLRVATVYT